MLCPDTVFMHFVWPSKQIVITVFPYTALSDCFYNSESVFTVQYRLDHSIYFTILFSEWPWNGLSISHKPLKAEYQVWSCDNPHDIYGGQSGTGTGFSASTSAFPCQYQSTNALHSPSSICCFYQKHKWAKPGNFHKQCSFINWKALDRNVRSLSS
jgi:hypothetical protein